MPEKTQVRVGVLGTGLIGIDLIGKIQRSPTLDCRLVAGRSARSTGLRVAAGMGCTTSERGIDALVEAEQGLDVVFDASNAESHAEHWVRLRDAGIRVVDLTPSNLGEMVVPSVNGDEAWIQAHVGLISCGGQASIPLLHAISRRHTPDYVEMVTTAASATVGPATRRNLDEYIDTTQAAIRTFTGCAAVKVLANISPADPPPLFRVTMTVLAAGVDPDTVSAIVEATARDVRRSTPGYAVTDCSIIGDQVKVTVEVTPDGRHIPRYAGNLEIINSAAVRVAELHRHAPSRPRAAPGAAAGVVAGAVAGVEAPWSAS